MKLTRSTLRQMILQEMGGYNDPDEIIEMLVSGDPDLREDAYQFMYDGIQNGSIDYVDFKDFCAAVEHLYDRIGR